MARVSKIDSPLLVIGLGGTGSEMARSIKNAFMERLLPAPGSDIPRRTQFLIIDTDDEEQDKQGWTDEEFVSISGNFWAIKVEGFQPWESSWFDEDFQDPDGLLTGGRGAGVYRQISRLFLFRKLTDVRNKLITAAANVLAVNPGENGDEKLEIRVLAGISGGTGSGTFLDMAYLIRHWLENDPAIRLTPDRYTLEAMLVLPDVTIQHHAVNDTTKSNLYSANGYAALTELDFWMNYEQHKHVFRQKYDHTLEVTWKGKPYNDVCLLTSRTTGNTQFTKAYEHVMQAAAEYMVNCFSRGVNSQNLNGHAGAVLNGHSFASVRNNDLASMEVIRRESFVPYAYRSIGAFSNAGDEEDINNRQWKLILDASVEAIDANKADMDGMQRRSIEEECIKQGVGHEDGSRVAQEFVDRHPIEELFGENFDVNKLKSMTYDTAPHGSDFDAFRQLLEDSLNGEKKEVYCSGWQILKTYVDNILRDPQKGPDYAYQVIMHEPNGLIAQLRKEKKQAAVQETEASDYALGYSGVEGSCANQHSEIKGINQVLHPIRANKMLETYKADTDKLYTQMRRWVYYRAQSDALDKLIEAFEKYAALLGDITMGVRKRQNEYNEMLAAREAAAETTTLLNSDRVQASLVAAFNAAGARQGMIQRAFNTIADTVNAAMELNKREFTAKEVARRLHEGIDSLRAACFQQIDAMTVQDKILTYGDVNGQTMQQYTVDVLLPRLTRGAMPMFDTNIQLNGTNSVHAYMGVVPMGANDIIQGITTFMTKNAGTYANLKFSNIADRIFWVTSVFGMPMQAYGALKGFEKIYRELKDTHRAVHLCMKAGVGLKDPVRQDWTKLPSPVCPRGIAESDGEARALALIESGVLTVDVEFAAAGGYYDKTPQIFWKRLRPIEHGVAFITRGQVEKKLEEFGKLPTPAERAAKAQELLDRAETIAVKPDALIHKVQAWISVLNKDRLSMDNMTPETPSDEREQLMKDWVESYRRAICEFISRNPQLLAEMEVNKECRELLEAKIAEWSRPDPEQMGQEAVTFAKMYRYGLIKQTMLFCRFENAAMANNNKIDANELEHDAAMKPNFPCFADYPVLLRNLVYYVAAIAQSDPRDVLQRDELVRIEKDINDAADAGNLPADIRTYLENASKLKDELDYAVTDVNSLFAGGKMKTEEREMVLNILEVMKNDTERFNRLWRRHVR